MFPVVGMRTTGFEHWMLFKSYNAPNVSVLKGGMSWISSNNQSDTIALFELKRKQMSSCSYISFGQKVNSRSQPSHCRFSCSSLRNSFPLLIPRNRAEIRWSLMWALDVSSFALHLVSVISINASSPQRPGLLRCSASCPPLGLCFSLFYLYLVSVTVIE